MHFMIYENLRGRILLLSYLTLLVWQESIWPVKVCSTLMLRAWHPSVCL